MIGQRDSQNSFVTIENSRSESCIILQEYVQKSLSRPLGLQTFVSNKVRDLSDVRTEVSKFVRVVQGACLELDNNLREMDSKKERNQQQMIRVTIGIEWNECIVGKPIPPRYETHVTEGTVLAEVLNKAAGECCPYNKYQSTYYGNDDLGHMITAMDGVLDDPKQDIYWMIFSDGELTPLGMDHYKPSADSITIFRLMKVDAKTAESTAGRPIGEIALILNSLIAKGSLFEVEQL